MGTSVNWLRDHIPADATRVAPPAVPQPMTIGPQRAGGNPAVDVPWLEQKFGSAGKALADLFARRAFDLTSTAKPTPEDLMNVVTSTAAPMDAAPFKLPSRWAVVSAELHQNPAADVAATKDLVAALRARKLPFQRVTGPYENPRTGQVEDNTSFMISNIHPNEAANLGRKFWQQSVLTHHGLHNLDTDMLAPSSGTGPAPAGSQNYFQLPGGQRMTSDLNFSAQEPMVHPFEHYSPRENLTALDPRYMGTGAAGRERARVGRPPMTHLYTPGAEPTATLRGTNKYTGAVAGRIFNADNAATVDEAKLLREGYTGYRRGTTIKAFGKIPVTAAPPEAAPDALQNMRDTGFAGGKTASMVEVPSAGAGRSGSTVYAVQAARQSVGDAAFRRMVENEVARRGGASAPEVTMAATEEIARRLASARTP
jgi:hypothetical protein